ncbi:hypothetical protein [uncultured Roseobacter sp.]|uniref:hypothetical protein n=1 Tax=uncultured Roseobacter sp. TaxID=114847 RepID=UPI002636DBEA|nr:hypothetical protein [uncultured Roseobacter sp.]
MNNSNLLNIWREIGAYLRFADAKNGVLFGLSATLASSYYSYVYIEPGVSWNVLTILGVKDTAAAEFLALSLFCAATLVSAVSVFPALSKHNVRVRIFNRIGKSLKITTSDDSVERSAYFFSDVAAFPTSKAYEEKLRDSSIIAGEISDGEKDIVEQIYVLSNIASSKYIQFVLSTVFLGLAAVIAFFL